MGAISKKLATRLRKAKKLLGDLRRQVAIDFSKIPRDLQGKVTLDTPGYDPLHAAYIAAQNFTGFFMEEVTKFPEFDSYWKIYGPAQKEYMPSGPPMSPLTKSYFTTWAFFDVRFGPDGETIGTCLLDVADLLGMDPFMVETIRQFQDSRMGIYEHMAGTRVVDFGYGNWSRMTSSPAMLLPATGASRGNFGTFGFARRFSIWWITMLPSRHPTS